MKKVWLSSLILMSIFTSCESETAMDNPDVPTGVDVYVAGKDGNQFKYWKNGEVTPLGITTEHKAYIESFDIDGTDVYTLVKDTLNYFNSNEPSTNNHKYYKNGNVVTLGFYGPIDCMNVINGDVYTCFREWSVANGTFWTKNGIQTFFNGGSYAGSLHAIKVKGGIVYIAGRYSDSLPCYFVNGTLTLLGPDFDDPNTNPSGYANDLEIDDQGNIYTVGHYSTNAFSNEPNYIPSRIYYSKNQQITYIDGTSEVEGELRYEGNGIAISDNDVYVIGYLFNYSSGQTTAKIWKNATEITLTQPSGVINSKYNDIQVLNGNVYVLGTLTFAGTVTKSALWINGVLTLGAEGTTGERLVVKQI